jgi:hypothetical protein
MSRYEFRPSHWPDHTSLTVGWDRPLDTFFAQVMDSSIPEDDDRVIVWLGAMQPYFSDVDTLMQTLNHCIPGRLQPVALTPAMRSTLIEDRQKDKELLA